MTDSDDERGEEQSSNSRRVGFDMTDEERFEFILESQEEKKGRELTEEEIESLKTRLGRVMNFD